MQSIYTHTHTRSHMLESPYCSDRPSPCDGDADDDSKHCSTGCRRPHQSQRDEETKKTRGQAAGCGVQSLGRCGAEGAGLDSRITSLQTDGTKHRPPPPRSPTWAGEDDIVLRSDPLFLIRVSCRRTLKKDPSVCVFES